MVPNTLTKINLANSILFMNFDKIFPLIRPLTKIWKKSKSSNQTLLRKILIEYTAVWQTQLFIIEQLDISSTIERVSNTQLISTELYPYCVIYHLNQIMNFNVFFCYNVGYLKSMDSGIITRNKPAVFK